MTTSVLLANQRRAEDTVLVLASHKIRHGSRQSSRQDATLRDHVARPASPDFPLLVPFFPFPPLEFQWNVFGPRLGRMRTSKLACGRISADLLNPPTCIYSGGVHHLIHNKHLVAMHIFMHAFRVELVICWLLPYMRVPKTKSLRSKVLCFVFSLLILFIVHPLTNPCL